MWALNEDLDPLLPLLLDMPLLSISHVEQPCMRKMTVVKGGPGLNGSIGVAPGDAACQFACPVSAAAGVHDDMLSSVSMGRTAVPWLAVSWDDSESRALMMSTTTST